ncbi:PREDICTED: GDP-mannose transporter GONST4 isoform X3 [Camelina sativa]|uniref:GDP-mannose transporter GONST4 isoform X1 n=1 Tax=Camelina sativa TaxID=90675 RepID=A0ABM0VCU8_CAMSA|nr:PREDICTED: GDP-mannose transporter GONST4 isoform X1 [Camelina sativa]XP_010454290.1 PREDICTED: GDP-mannose transporter GONST4 isoform X2 [Camelina sativa]XP_019090417.1 PREDICTED: GDP-mannose transporter GONST4 isoform X3 [Camelina sativa]
MSSSRFDSSKQYTTTSLVIGYALCSSLLAVINKFAITYFNYPGLLTALQYLTCTFAVWLLGKLGFLHHDPFTWETAKKFLPAAIVFYLAIFTNTNLLRHANVDTFIVFRSLTPLLVAIADTIFRSQPLPSRLTFLSLIVILAGAVGYVATDSAFTLTAYSWALAYLVTITTEMVYIKHMVSHLGLNIWGYVLYNNLLSLMIAPIFWFLTGEYTEVFAAVNENRGNLFEPVAFSAVALSCVFGFLISYFGFAARNAISATAFTVTGVVNKFLTVVINVLIWDKHATPVGLVCLLFTICGGVGYQQSVALDKPVDTEKDNKKDSEKGEEDEELTPLNQGKIASVV